MAVQITPSLVLPQRFERLKFDEEYVVSWEKKISLYVSSDYAKIFYLTPCQVVLFVDNENFVEVFVGAVKGNN